MARTGSRRRPITRTTFVFLSFGSILFVPRTSRPEDKVLRGRRALCSLASFKRIIYPTALVASWADSNRVIYNADKRAVLDRVPGVPTHADIVHKEIPRFDFHRGSHPRVVSILYTFPVHFVVYLLGICDHTAMIAPESWL